MRRRRFIVWLARRLFGDEQVEATRTPNGSLEIWVWPAEEKGAWAKEYL